MSCMSQNFRLFHVSNLSVRNFRIFLLMYTGSVNSGYTGDLRAVTTHTWTVVPHRYRWRLYEYISVFHLHMFCQHFLRRRQWRERLARQVCGPGSLVSAVISPLVSTNHCPVFLFWSRDCNVDYYVSCCQKHFWLIYKDGDIVCNILYVGMVTNKIRVFDIMYLQVKVKACQLEVVQISRHIEFIPRALSVLWQIYRLPYIWLHCSNCPSADMTSHIPASNRTDDSANGASGNRRTET